MFLDSVEWHSVEFSFQTCQACPAEDVIILYMNAAGNNFLSGAVRLATLIAISARPSTLTALPVGKDRTYLSWIYLTSSTSLD